jgi:hypothetical protein
MRVLADLPWMGWAMRLRLHTRRFFCDNSECERQIFAERLPNVVAHYARRTLRLTDVLTVIGFDALRGGRKTLVQGPAFDNQPRYLASSGPSCTFKGNYLFAHCWHR